MLMENRPRALPGASVAVGIARPLVVAVGHAVAVPVAAGAAPAIGRWVVAVGNAVAIAVPVPVVGHAVAVSVGVGALRHGAAVGRRVVAGGDAVMAPAPAARSQVPLAATLHPYRRVVTVAGAGLDPVTIYPDMLVAAPLPVAGHPDHAASGRRRHFVAWRWRGRLDDEGGRGSGLRGGRKRTECKQGDGSGGQGGACHGDLLTKDSSRNRKLYRAGIA